MLPRIRKFIKFDPKLKQQKFVFVAWLNIQMEKFAKSNVETLDEEIRALRRGPPHPEGLLEIISDGKEFTLPGSAVHILFDPKKITPNQIIDYCQNLGFEIKP